MLSLRIHPAVPCLLLARVGWRVWLVALALVIVATSGAARDYVDVIGKLTPGLTEAQVLELLGLPDSKLPAPRAGLEGDAWYYRISTLAKRNGRPLLQPESLTTAGRVRCEFKGGVLLRVAGIWPPPARPTKDAPKTKVLLVDVNKVYEGLVFTHRFTANMRKKEAEKQEALDALNAAGHSLIEQHEKARDAWKQYKGDRTEKLALESRANALKAEIQKKEAEVEQFRDAALLEMQILVDRYQDAVLPAISEVILKFKTERGYDYVYEINQSVLSPGIKPVFVSGVDETYEIVKWIDAGHAKGTGF